MSGHGTPKSNRGKEDRHIPSASRPVVSTLYAPVAQSSEPDLSKLSRSLRDGSVNSSEAPEMAEQSCRSNTAVNHPNIQITDSNTPPVAQNAGVSQEQSHDGQPPERERTTSNSPISPSSPPAGDGNETDETEYCDEGVDLDGTDEGVDIDLLLQRVADDEARKRNEGE